MTSSPLYANIARWQEELKGGPDEQYIVEGIHSGFYITKPDIHVKPAYCSNYRSATCIENRPRVDEQLRREVDLGRYHVTSVKPPIISAIGAIPKPNSNDLRIIQDFSRPLGRSVNSYAEPDSHSFVSVDTATRLLQGFMYSADADGSGRTRTDADGRGYFYKIIIIIIFFLAYIDLRGQLERDPESDRLGPPTHHDLMKIY